jgi:Ca-activated chloride channel homolog
MSEAQLQTKNGVVIPLLGVDAVGSMVGLFLRMTITQRYHNNTHDPLEVMYTFPLPAAAVLLQAEIHVRGVVYQSQVHAKPKASQKYTEAVAAGDTAILVAQVDDLYSIQIGNVPAGEQVAIHITYGEMLVPNDGVVRVSLPTTIAPRYGTPPATMRPEQVPFSDLFVRYPFTYQLTVWGRAASTLEVPSHIATIASDETATTIAIDGVSMDRDVVVLAHGYQGYCGSLTASHARQQWLANYVTIPPTKTAPVAKPMHVKLLIDCSGSMGGTSITQARQAVVRLLQLLTDGDSIAVTRFGSDVQDVTAGLMKVGAVVRKQMNAWLKTVNSDLGGTETVGAVEHVLNMPTNGTDCDVILITDGETYGVDRVAQRALKAGHRIYPMVIGFAPADGQLQKLAQITGGFCEVVTPNERIEDAMARIVRRIKADVVLDVAIEYGEGVVAWKQGRRLQYVGDTALLTAVLDRAVTPHLRVGTFQTPIATTTVPDALTADFVRTIAAQHLADLVGDAQQAWAEHHQLLSEQTAVVAVATHASDAKVIGTAVKTVVAQELAYDWHGSAGVMESGQVFSAAPIPRMIGASFAGSVRRSSSPSVRTSNSRPSSPPAGDSLRENVRRSSAPPRDIMHSQSVNPFGPATRKRGSSGVLANIAKLIPGFSKGDTEHEAPAGDMNRYVAAVTKALTKVKRDIRTLTLAHLLAAGLPADIIDACQAIAGYSEAQIVQALVAVILGDDEAARYQGAANDIPVALRGGITVVLQTAG